MKDSTRHRDAIGSLGKRAAEDLRVIRETMERATAFTALSGFGAIVIGITALGATFIAAGQTGDGKWLAVWLLEALLATAIGIYSIQRKARATNIPLHRPTTRKLAWSFGPAVAAGALLTLVLQRDGHTALLPGTWLLLYGTGIVTGGLVSEPVITVMGICFMVLGAITLMLPASLGDLFMALGFGGIHIVFGMIILRRYGG